MFERNIRTFNVDEIYTWRGAWPENNPPNSSMLSLSHWVKMKREDKKLQFKRKKSIETLSMCVALSLCLSLFLRQKLHKLLRQIFVIGDDN